MNSAVFLDLIVNGEIVPHNLIAAETQNHEGPAGKPGIAWRKAANALAIRTLLLQEAKARNVAVEQQEVGAGRVETDEEALIRGLLDNVINVKTPQSDAIFIEWKKDPTRFRAPPLWEVSHILCACDPCNQEARQKTKYRAETLTKLTVKDPKGFSAIASQESDCRSKASGGALGQFGPGDTVPEFEAILRQLEEDTITQTPSLTRYGWHIVRMDAVAQGEVLPFQAVEQKISDTMEKVAWAHQARAFVANLVASAEITGADFRPI